MAKIGVTTRDASPTRTLKSETSGTDTKLLDGREIVESMGDPLGAHLYQIALLPRELPMELIYLLLSVPAPQPTPAPSPPSTVGR